MFLKSLIFLFFAVGSLQNTNAQRVIRKGVTENRPAGNNGKPVPKYSISQLNGKWQEVKRVSIDSNLAVSFSDSLLLDFKEDKVEVKDATSMRMTMKGEAQIEAPNTLVAAADVFKIRSLDKRTLIIGDGEFVKELQKKEQFYYETLGKLKVEQDTVSKPVSIDIKNVKGKWIVYARKAIPGATNDQTALIRSLDIGSISEDGIAFGQATFYTKDFTKTLPCQMVTKDGAIKIVTDQYIWNFYTYKADGVEFVFGETGKLVYYAKH